MLVDFKNFYNPANIYMFKVNNKNTRTRSLMSLGNKPRTLFCKSFVVRNSSTPQ